MVNKLLYPNVGSKTYMFKLGDCLASIGHQVKYIAGVRTIQIDDVILKAVQKSMISFSPVFTVLRK